MQAEYEAIKEFYGERRAKRSQVALMAHIDEGLKILDMLGASDAAKGAYCIHPLFQHDDDLVQHGLAMAVSGKVSAHCVALAMEYRFRANSWLSDKVRKDLSFDGFPSAGPIEDVRYMLIADKIQNKKDFVIHHKATHPRSTELSAYFNIWLESLNIPHNVYLRITEQLK